MRVIAGTARGMRLTAPKGLEVRPTLDRVRESLFNILAPRIEGARFLDLFAGTGANGIEALSRGAQRAVFVDQEERALTAIRANLQSTRLSDHATVVRLTLPTGLGRLDGVFDTIFADPPYEFRAFEALFDGVLHSSLLDADGILVLEHASKTLVPEDVAGYRRYRQATYGDTALSFFS